MSDEAQVTVTTETESKPATPSILLTLRAEWEKAGGKMPDAKTKAALTKAYTDAKSAKDAAEKALADATLKLDAAVLAIAKSVGGQSPINMAGQTLHLSARGNRVFFKTFAEKSPVVF